MQSRNQARILVDLATLKNHKPRECGLCGTINDESVFSTQDAGFRLQNTIVADGSNRCLLT